MTARGRRIIGRIGTLLLLAMLAVGAWAPAASATTPTWYPQLRLAMIDARAAGAAIDACVAPHAASTAGRSCALTHASDDANALQQISVYTEEGTVVGSCKRLLFQLDHATTSAAARALAFAAAEPTATTTADVGGRHALEQGVTSVNGDFAALRHCLGK